MFQCPRAKKSENDIGHEISISEDHFEVELLEEESIKTTKKKRKVIGMMKGNYDADLIANQGKFQVDDYVSRMS